MVAGMLGVLYDSHFTADPGRDGWSATPDSMNLQQSNIIGRMTPGPGFGMAIRDVPGRIVLPSAFRGLCFVWLALLLFFLAAPLASAQTITTALADANAALSAAKAAYAATPPAPAETVKKGGIDWMLAHSQRLINEATSASDIPKATLAKNLANDALAAVGNSGYGARQVTKPEWLPAIASTATNPGFPSLFTITTYNTVTPSNPLLSGGTSPTTGDAQKLAYAVCHAQSPVMGNATGVTALLTMLNEGHQKTALTQGERWSEASLTRAYLILKATYPTLIPSSIDTAWKAVMRARAEEVRSLFAWAFSTTNYLQNSWLNADAREIPNLGYYAQALNDASYEALMDNYLPKMYLTLQPDGATNYTGYQNEAWTYHAEGINVMAWYRYFAPNATLRRIADDYVKKCGAYHPLTTTRFVHEEYTAPEQKHYWNKGRPQQSYMGYIARDPYAVAACQDNTANHLLAFAYDPTVYVRTPATVTLPDNYTVFDRNIIGVRGKFGLTDYALTTRDFSYFPGKTTSTGTTTPVKGFGVTTFFGMRRMYTTADEKTYGWPNNAILERVMNRVVIRDASGNVTTTYDKGQDITSSVTMTGNVTALSARYKCSRNGQNTSWTAIPYDNIQEWIVTPERAIGFMRIESLGSATRTEIQAGFDFVSGREGQWGVRKTFKPLSDPAYTDGNASYSYSAGVNATYQYGDLQLSVLGSSYSTVQLSYGPGSVLSPATDLMKGKLRLVTPDKAITTGASDWCLVEVRPLATTSNATAAGTLALSNGLYGFRFVEGGRSYTMVHNPGGTTQVLDYTAPAGYASYSLHLGSSSGVDRNKYLTREQYEASIKTDSGWRTVPLASAAVSYSIPPGRHVLIVGSNAAADHASGWKYYPDVFPPNRAPTALEQWLKANFGSLAGDGKSNEASDADGDGEVNALEFATAQDPAAATQNVLTSVTNGSWTEFTYRRSKAALAAGTAFLVEYSDNAAGGIWSSSGINQEPPPLAEDATSQTMKIQVPAAANRAIRLMITLPGATPMYESVTGALSATWTANASSTWGLGTNWAGGMPAQGADQTATFSANATLTVTNDSLRSIGALQFTAGNVTLAGSALTFDSASAISDVQVSAGANATLNLPTTATGALTKSGNGTLTLSKPVTGAAGIDILAGRLRLTGNLTTGGNATHSLTVRSGTFFELSNTTAIGADWTLEMMGGQTDVSAGSSNVWPGPVTISGSNNRWNIVSGQLTLSGEISGTSGYHKDGAGMLVVSGSNPDFTGSTNLNSGTLRIAKSDALAASTVSMNGGALAFSISNPTLGNLVAASPVRNIALQDVSAAPVALSVGASGSSGTYNGTFSGNGSLAKVGSGTWTIAAAQPFTGAISVAGGTLALGGNLTGALSVSSGGTLAPLGSPSIAGNVTFSPGSILRVRINGPAAGTEFDQLQAAGSVALAGSPAIVAAAGLPLNSTSYLILNKTSAGAFAGTFSGLAESALIDSGGYLWRISYAGGTGNDISVTPTLVMTADMSWRFANFGTVDTSGSAADGADPDGDGATNATERANGTNPNVANVPVVSITSPSVSPVSLSSKSQTLELSGAVQTSGAPLASVAWSKVSGPGTVTFSSPSGFTTGAGFSASGIYVLRLSGTSGTATGSADVTVLVEPPGALTFREGVGGYAHTGTMIRGDGGYAAFNSGARNEILIGKTSAPMRGLFSFDLSSVPGGLVPASVRLDLWTSGSSGALASTLQLFRLHLEPAEGTGTGGNSTNADTGATWARRTNAAANVPWKGNGTIAGADPGTADYAPEPLSTVASAVPVTSQQKTFDSAPAFVAAVGTALAGDRRLNLLAIAPEMEANATTNNYFRFCSDDYATESSRPLLTITFDAPGVLPTASAGVPLAVTAGGPASLAGTATNATSTTWSLVSGPGIPDFADASDPGSSVTFDVPGSYTLRLTAANGSGEVSSTLVVTVTPPATAFERWQALHWPGVSNPATIGPVADPDGDGLPNLLEFAVGRLPGTPENSPGSVSLAGGTLEFTYPRSHEAVADGINFIVEWSDTLGNDWSTAGVTHAAVPGTDNGTTELWKATMPAGSAESRFVRLKVQYP